MNRPTGRLSVLARGLCLLFAACICRRADAQVGVAYEEPLAITARDLAGFNRLFHTSTAQETSAQSLLDASTADLKQQELRQVKIGEAWRAIPKDKRTPEGREKLLKELTAAEPDIPAARRKLLLDLRALLDKEQEANWPRFERFLRRSEWQLRGWGAAEKANLLALIEKLALDAPQRALLDAPLDRYERELDAILIDLEPQYKELSKANLAIWTREQQTGTPEVEARRAAGAEYAATHHRLVLLNDRFIDQLRALIPEDQRTAWQRLCEQATLTDAYGLNARWMNSAVRGTADLPALDDSRREAIRGYLKDYTAEYDALTAKIAATQRKLRSAAPGEQVERTDWDAWRIRRMNLLGEAQRKLQELLTQAQWERMMLAASEQEKKWDDEMLR